MGDELLKTLPQLPIVFVLLYVWQETRKDRAAVDAAAKEERKEWREWWERQQEDVKEVLKVVATALDRNTAAYADVSGVIRHCEAITNGTWNGNERRKEQ